MQSDNIYAPPNSDLDKPEGDHFVFDDDSLASRWARLGAWIVDGLVFTVTVVALMHFTGYLDKAAQNSLSIQESIILSSLGLADYLALNGYLLAKKGQSVGKWALGIKIVDLKNGMILSLWRVFFVRYIPQVVVSMVPLFGGFLLLIESLFIFRNDKRCIHDLIASTIVVKEHAHDKRL